LNNHNITSAEPVTRLIDEFGKLPGIGPKSAARLAYHILRVSEAEARALAEAILLIKEKTVLCSVCQNVAEIDPCRLCSSDTRDRTMICVVKEPLDIIALERTGRYKGLYHVLHGVISPMDGIGPDDLKIKELLQRIKSEVVNEVIVATNPNLEGEATAMYIQRLLSPFQIQVTRLARGLSIGSDLEYADEVTLSHALDNRQEI